MPAPTFSGPILDVRPFHPSACLLRGCLPARLQVYTYYVSRSNQLMFFVLVALPFVECSSQV